MHVCVCEGDYVCLVACWCVCVCVCMRERMLVCESVDMCMCVHMRESMCVHVLYVCLKGATAVKFSPGGQYIAIANTASITVLSAYTTELVCTLRGHTDKVGHARVCVCVCVCFIFSRVLNGCFCTIRKIHGSEENCFVWTCLFVCVYSVYPRALVSLI